MEQEEKTFVAKAVKIKNNKAKDYYLFRMTIPKEVAEELKLQSNDHLVIKAKKASWYHLLDWSQMDKSWDMLPDSAKKEIVELRLPMPKGVVVAPQMFNYAISEIVGTYTNTASSYISDKGTMEQSPLLTA